MAVDLQQSGLGVNIPAFSPEDFPDAGEPPPKRNKRKRPTQESVMDMVAHIKPRYQERQLMLQLVEEVWDMVKPEPEPGSGQQTVALPDGQQLVDKIARRLGAAKITEQVVAASELEVTEDAAQREEDFDRWWIYEMDLLHSEMLRSPFQYELAFMAAFRGAICQYITADPENTEFPWKVYTCDWANIYPTFGDDAGKPILMIVRSRGDEIKMLFPDAPKLNDIDDSAEYDIYYHFDDEWMGVSMENGVVLERFREHGYGFNPMIVTPVGSNPVRSTEWSNIGWVKNVGRGILHPVAEWIIEFNKILSQAFSSHAKAYDPPLVSYWDKASNVVRTVEIDTRPGGQTNLPPGVERIDVLHPRPAPAETSQLFNKFQSAVDRLLPALAFGEIGTNQGGFGMQVAKAASDDAYFPGGRALELHLTKLLMRVKKMMANPLLGMQAVMVSAQGKAFPFTPEDAELKTKKVITLSNITPQDWMGLMAMAIQAKQVAMTGIEDSLKIAAGQFDEVAADPKGVMQRLLAEMVNLNPEVAKVNIAKANAELGRMADLQAFTQLTPSPQPPQPPQPPAQVVPPEAMGQGEIAQPPPLEGQRPMPQVGTNGRGPY